MVRYASGTSVSVDRSLGEIKSIITRFGASEFAYGERSSGQAAIEFVAQDRRVRFVLTLPDRTDKRFLYTAARHTKRSEKAAYEAWEQACRERWRALTLCVKAKLAAVNDGISTFEDEFMAHVVDPITGRTMGELLRPAIADRYQGVENNARGLLGLPAPKTKHLPEWGRRSNGQTVELIDPEGRVRAISSTIRDGRGRWNVHDADGVRLLATGYADNVDQAIDAAAAWIASHEAENGESR